MTFRSDKTDDRDFRYRLTPSKEPFHMEITKRDPLLDERQKTHGDFRSNAAISQRIKKVINENTTNVAEDLCDVHREALDMIAVKLSRILSGQADFKDHWDDIAGYAKLASEVCSK